MPPIFSSQGKLELVTGSVAANMKLEVYDKDDKLICKLDSDDALLGSFPVDDGMRLHVVDATVRLGEFEDTSKVEKYEMSEDAYSKRSDSVRAFKERNKMGRFKEISPEEQNRLAEEKAKKDEAEKQKAESINIGDRCEVRVPEQPAKRGQVKYVGLTDFKEGLWVGVQYDEPMGKNDGSVKGKQYFECPDKYGGFVRVSHVEVGDFPEEDLGFSDDDEI
ncbi:tubulin-folding cofactor B-like isoform X2 [Ylistrum balloti]|uniref:tubulin-folding cofactor B-like isoform X2 n=1 Tax=Ylistrum balloti TaxID=509963 RepID=UPI002905EA65|nr:tubulin-folding cofactor B-like isoform X2 [Ylistrum balloti]